MPEKPACPCCGTTDLETYFACPQCHYKRHANENWDHVEFIASASLRDRFAAAAIQGMLSRTETIPFDNLAADAYEVADRMLVERRMSTEKATPP